MTTAALPARAATTRARERRDRFLELMLVGGATLVLLPLAWIIRRVAGLDAPEYAVGFLTFYGAYVVNDPHFAVTYFLFYKDVRRRTLGSELGAAQRVRYWIAGFVVPVALVAWAATALAVRSAQALGWMVQLMFLLVGWHYAKQGFGVLSVLWARRRVTLTQRERSVILAHCYAAWAFAWANPSAPAGTFEEKGVVYRALAHPLWLEMACGLVLAATTVAMVAVLAAKWRREREALPLGPLVVFLVTIWSWTIYSSFDPLVRYVIPALHSVQYLYFVWLMKRNEARASEGPPAFGRPAAVRLGVLALSALGLGWLLFHGAPGFLDAALVGPSRAGKPIGDLGETPFVAAFFVVVSLHHYFMDHVIWRRDNPDTRFLRTAAG